MALKLTRQTNQIHGLVGYAREMLDKFKPNERQLRAAKAVYVDSCVNALGAFGNTSDNALMYKKYALDLLPKFGTRNKKLKLSKCLGSEVASIDGMTVTANVKAATENESYPIAISVRRNNDGKQVLRREIGLVSAFLAQSIAEILPNVNGNGILKTLILTEQIRHALTKATAERLGQRTAELFATFIATSVVYGNAIRNSEKTIDKGVGLLLHGGLPFWPVKSDCFDEAPDFSTQVAFVMESAINAQKDQNFGFNGIENGLHCSQSLIGLQTEIKSGESFFDLELPTQNDDIWAWDVFVRMGKFALESTSPIAALIIAMANMLTEKHRKSITNPETQKFPPIEKIIVSVHPDMELTPFHSGNFTIVGEKGESKSAAPELKIIHDLQSVWSVIVNQGFDNNTDLQNQLLEFWSKYHRGTDFPHFKKAPELPEIQIHKESEFKAVSILRQPSSVTLVLKDGTQYTSGKVVNPPGFTDSTQYPIEELIMHKLRWTIGTEYSGVSKPFIHSWIEKIVKIDKTSVDYAKKLMEVSIPYGSLDSN